MELPVVCLMPHFPPSSDKNAGFVYVVVAQYLPIHANIHTHTHTQEPTTSLLLFNHPLYLPVHGQQQWHGCDGCSIMMAVLYVLASSWCLIDDGRARLQGREKTAG